MQKSFKKLLFCVLTFTNVYLFSQPLSIDENQRAHRRYWYYRTRMINDFMKVGGAQGDCIVQAERNQGRGDLSAWIGPDQIDITNQYMSALALEYKLLTRNNQSTTETIKELFYLIKTLNRLDAFADILWEPSPPTSDDFSGKSQSVYLNGFMLREDMPRNYLKDNITHFNYELLENGYNGTPSSVPNPVVNYKSFTGLDHVNYLYKGAFNEFDGFLPYITAPTGAPRLKIDLVNPHDKYYSMFIAFMFIRKYLPAGTTYSENGVVQSFQDGETDIREEVLKITNRCHPFLRGNTFGGPLSNWIMENPDGTAFNNLGQPNLYSYALATIICHINGNYPFNNPCNSKQDAVSLSLGYSMYNLLFLNPIPSVSPLLGSDDAAVFTLNGISGSNSAFYSGLLPAYIGMDLCTTINSMEWANLLRIVLHQNGLILKGKAAYADPINVAPCIGPYNFGGVDNAGFEWKSQDRLEHPKSRYTSSPVGNYPGVDYMLLHNLYYEYLNQLDDKPFGNEVAAYKNAYNYMDNEDHSDWPKKIGYGSGAITLGVNATDPQHILGNVKVFQYLKSTAHIYPTSSPAAPGNTTPSNVTYRAGKEISLQPGFQVLSGSTFYGYIKRYVCGVDDYEAGMRLAKDSTKGNDYEGDDMNDYAMHYVEYPKSDADNYPNSIEETDADNNTTTIDNDLIIIPNPSSGIFNVQVKKINEDETLTINVYDMKGNLILKFTNVSVNTEINLEGFSKGIYMIHLISNTGNSKIKKVSVVD